MNSDDENDISYVIFFPSIFEKKILLIFKEYDISYSKGKSERDNERKLFIDGNKEKMNIFFSIYGEKYNISFEEINDF